MITTGCFTSLPRETKSPLQKMFFSSKEFIILHIVSTYKILLLILNSEIKLETIELWELLNTACNLKGKYIDYFPECTWNIILSTS